MMLTGRVRKGQQNDLRRAGLVKAFSDERRLDAVEQLVPLAEEAGLPMAHLAMAFAIAHPGVTSALLGPRTMEHLDDLLAGFDVTRQVGARPEFGLHIGCDTETIEHRPKSDAAFPCSGVENGLRAQ